MSLPGVRITETDNQLGVLSASDGKLFAIIGVASAGPFNTPSSFSRVKDLVTQFGYGRGVEACAYYIERYQRPVLFVRAEPSGTAAVSAVEDHDATGTSVITVSNGAAPKDDYEIALQILTGGTVGVAGITYRVSLDNGRNWSGARALGTGNTIVLPDDAGVTLALAAGTLVANEHYTATATGATFNASDLEDALEPLSLTQLQWEFVLIDSPMDASMFDKAEEVGAYTNGKHIWLGYPRITNAGETDSAYQAAMSPLSEAKATKHGACIAGGSKTSSSISGRSYRRPLAWGVAARQASVQEHINIAERSLGPLPGVSIRDANGNPDEHDEFINPGLDDMRYVTARTWPRRAGVYVTRPRLFSPTTSDFQLIPHRRVMNLAHEALEDYLADRCHKPILVSRKTGRILASEATEIELGANAVLAAVLLSKPKASGAVFTLSRTDNLLSLPRVTCGAKILPLAYPEWFDLDLSFTNPAMQLEAV